MSAPIVPEGDPALERVARKTTPAAALAALGIVYGDLGTSPLYTLQAVVRTTGGHLSPEAALGSLSLIFWALIITISVKYCLFVMRADNHGEGGILALMSMTSGNWTEGRRVLIVLGLFGAALLYGDGIITPAISVLSALEGLNVATDVFKPHVVLMAVAILFALFAIQRRGTAQIAKVSGPVMLLWFAVIAALGVSGIARHPAVIAAVDPRYGIALLIGHGWSGIAVLGGVFLAMTGAEAMYADMATSAAIRSALPGTESCCRRCCSTMPGRSHFSSTTRRWTGIRSFGWRRHGRSIRLWDLPPLPRSLPARRSSPDRFR